MLFEGPGQEPNASGAGSGIVWGKLELRLPVWDRVVIRAQPTGFKESEKFETGNKKHRGNKKHGPTLAFQDSKLKLKTPRA